MEKQPTNEKLTSHPAEGVARNYFPFFFFAPPTFFFGFPFTGGALSFVPGPFIGGAFIFVVM